MSVNIEGVLAVSVPEAAKKIGVSRNTAYGLCQSGLLPSVKLGGRIIVPMKRLEEFLDKMSREPRAKE